ncbi:hypothetical protein LEP1GSC165_0027 [Leptospira santarosai str. CBC523]|nr:hypothetical protein LEP1GSC165_0027 [Leptospira santarosai str. CBC523]
MSEFFPDKPKTESGIVVNRIFQGNEYDLESFEEELSNRIQNAMPPSKELVAFDAIQENFSSAFEKAVEILNSEETESITRPNER